MLSKVIHREAVGDGEPNERMRTLTVSEPSSCTSSGPGGGESCETATPRRFSSSMAMSLIKWCVAGRGMMGFALGLMMFAICLILKRFVKVERACSRMGIVNINTKR